MDIQISSNFERLLFEAYGRDGKAIRALMASLAQSRRFTVSTRALSEIRALFTADRAERVIVMRPDQGAIERHILAASRAAREGAAA